VDERVEITDRHGARHEESPILSHGGSGCLEDVPFVCVTPGARDPSDLDIGRAPASHPAFVYPIGHGFSVGEQPSQPDEHNVDSRVDIVVRGRTVILPSVPGSDHHLRDTFVREEPVLQARRRRRNADPENRGWLERGSGAFVAEEEVVSGHGPTLGIGAAIAFGPAPLGAVTGGVAADGREARSGESISQKWTTQQFRKSTRGRTLTIGARGRASHHDRAGEIQSLEHFGEFVVADERAAELDVGERSAVRTPRHSQRVGFGQFRGDDYWLQRLVEGQIYMNGPAVRTPGRGICATRDGSVMTQGARIE
jgi:hypothetical protein